MNEKPTYDDLEKEIVKLKRELQIKDEILNQIPNPIFVKDENFKYTYCNDSFSNYIGLPKQKIINATVYDISCKELAELYNKADIELAEKQKEQIYQSKVKYADGTLHDIIFHKACLFNENKDFKGIVGLMIDITEKLKAEQELIESDTHLRELNNTKDKLFSIIGHDLRSPFNNILGFSDLLIKRQHDPTFKDSEKYLKIINGLANNTLILLDNLLNWAKSQTGVLNINKENLLLSDIINEEIKLNKPIAKTKNIALNCFNEEEIKIFGDKNLLKTVFRNLISNAIKFTKPEGEIKIFVIKKNDWVEVTISDNGIGINKEKLKDFFNLSQIKSTVGTANEKGSGLGLVLCKEFVEKHGGKIWVESEFGKGSDFKFTLPLNKLE
ncbi:PAS domain-containing sensor histidine kinase [Polaribacter sp.]|uniref:PAS domain-containing sensor histidine kinase n=1 Tax=Polaribacter sp. TaxID=1920175 RepID=UPI00404829AE